ncbi:MAG TPA: PIN/TRAM domain-containing protein [Bacillota bacterium]|nr:PIN/TRAM domain-containing protein [Bacillota bacterium]
MVTRIIRIMVFLIFTGAGAFIGKYVPVGDFPSFQLIDPTLMAIGLGLLFGAVAGILLSPWVTSKIIQVVAWLEQRLQKTPIQELIGGSVGLIAGLIIALLLGEAFSSFPLVGALIKSVGALLLGYLGMSLGSKKREELFGVSHILSRFNREKGAKPDIKPINLPKILDTSVIIDGRIADIVKSGFVEGALVIPGFVLEELRHIADSSDLLKRNRGRRGLDILNKIRKELGMKVHIHETDFDDITEVDSKLVRLAQLLDGKIVTNDFNLNKVAELQGVGVLNINELANAVKPVVLPGEEMVVQVVKDGKESGQGVGYLDDGTMIVIENGRKYIGQTIGVIVTSVLQTAAGRMIFAKAKLEKRSEQSGQPQLNEVNAIV